MLEDIKMLDELIDAKIAERGRIRALVVNTVGNMDGMPHAPGISDKVGNLTVKLISIEEEIDALVDKYVDQKNEVLRLIESLSAKEYGVLHRYYFRRMTLEQVGEDMKLSTMQVWRIKEKGIASLQKIINDL